jgi:nucleotide-binding universal stress UspA family protein
MVALSFERVVVPVASRDDAASTATTLRPYVADGGATVVAVHVVEKAEGALDKASVEQREQDARDAFATFAEVLDAIQVTLETEIRYGSDVAGSIIQAAHDADASAIAFTPRGGSRWQKLLSGDPTHRLVEHTDVPVVVLPNPETSED